MNGDALIVFVILAITVALFMSERLRLDVVALLALLALLLTGILTPAEGLAGFSNSAVIVIAALFVVGQAMFRTGLAERFGNALARVAGAGRARLTAVLMLGTGLLSAFVSTTGTVALMLPVAASLARGARISPSLLLMPLSVAALLGGLLTLIATPPNIIVSEALAGAGVEPFRLFDFTPIGLVLLAAGIAVLVPFAGRLLPARAPVDRPAGSDPVATVAGAELVKGYEIGEIARVRVHGDSPLVGRSVVDAALKQRYGVTVVAVRRRQARGGRMTRLPRTSQVSLHGGDELELHGDAEAVERLCREQGLEVTGRRGTPDAVLAEVLLTPRSRLIGRTLADLRFRSRYGVNVLSLRRRAQAVEGDIATLPLEFADTLLVSGSPERIDLLRGETGDFVVVAQTKELVGRGPMSRHEVATLAVLVGMLLLLAFDVVPSVVAVLLAAMALVLTGSVDMEGAYRAISWQSVVLIGAMLPMATALEKTGGIETVISLLRPFAAGGPLALLVGVFLLTAALGMFISNTATAVLVAPVALGAALELGVSPRPLLMTVAIAASTSFATPVATPANLLVIGPGDYRFGDFLRVGLLIQGLVLLLTVVLVPLLFPF